MEEWHTLLSHEHCILARLLVSLWLWAPSRCFVSVNCTIWCYLMLTATSEVSDVIISTLQKWNLKFRQVHPHRAPPRLFALLFLLSHSFLYHCYLNAIHPLSLFTCSSSTCSASRVNPSSKLHNFLLASLWHPGTHSGHGSQGRDTADCDKD